MTERHGMLVTIRVVLRTDDADEARVIASELVEALRYDADVFTAYAEGVCPCTLDAQGKVQCEKGDTDDA